ncbi:hypothetical protein [Amycolatopsis sp. WAC 04182]|uniref:hypothetical protein n=1 Tax=Amycolatopsis sp. WAC 04182 TaxID=2203198 RepID=UPI000F7B4E97|nr:hypothetical protein [Amycolatopsis sp. WAC 04182]
MSRFHDQLIAARRRGEAPGQNPIISPEQIPVTYDYVRDIPVGVCTRCFGAVPVDRVAEHVDWHDRNGA